MGTPLQVKQSLNNLITSCFGSFAELEQLITPRDLEYIYNYPNKIVIYRVWELELDLLSLGKEFNDEYQILDKHLNWIKTIYNSNNLSTDLDIIKYVFNLKHGDYFHLVFKRNNSFEILLVWVIKEKSKQEKQALVNKWSFQRNQNQPTYYQTGELTINNPAQGWVQIYSLPGDLFNIPNVNLFLGTNESTLVLSSNEEVININPALNRWYAIFFIYNNEAELMYLDQITGTGIQKITQKNGIIYLSLLGTLETELEGIDRLNTNKISITAKLKPALITINNITLTDSLGNKQTNLNFFVRQYNSRATSIITLVNNKIENMTPEILTGSLRVNSLTAIVNSKQFNLNHSIESTEIINSSIVIEKARKELQIVT